MPSDSYLQKIPVLRNLEELSFDYPVTFFAGENGSGKSTLLEAVAVAFGFNAEGGTLNYCFSTYEDVSELSRALTLTRGYRKPRNGYFFRAESFFNVATATALKYNDDGKLPELPDYHARSHGESFLTFLQRSGRDGLYIMDEPEAALSPQRQLSLLRHIWTMAEAGAQFLIATHSPILLGIPGAQILSFDGETIAPCTYEETAAYQMTKLFLEDRERVLWRLLEEE